MDAYTIIRETMDEFKDVPEEKVRVFISLAEPLISKRRFGKLYEQALAYLAAHKMKVLGGLGKKSIAGTVGDTYGIASVTEGKTSVTFSTSQQGGNLSKEDGEYSMTTYGSMYLTLRSRVTIPIICGGEVRVNG